MDTVYVGFAEDRIEITEGHETFADIAVDAFFADPPDPESLDRPYRFELEILVEPGSGTAGDVVVDGVVVGNRKLVLEPRTTWIPVQALADGLVEQTETLTLRMRPVPGEEYRGYPPAIEVVNPTMEVVIRDEGGGICSNVSITGTHPRNISRPNPRRACPVYVLETRITVEANVGDPVYVDRAPPYGRIHGWRVQSDESRIRHELVLQWSVDRSWEMRLEACPGTGRGPTLVCSAEACETYEAGASIPAPRIPARCRQG